MGAKGAGMRHASSAHARVAIRLCFAIVALLTRASAYHRVADVRLGQITLSTNQTTFAATGVLIPPGRSLFFSIAPPRKHSEPVAYLVEVFYDDAVPPPLRPDPFLLAQLNEDPRPYSQSVRFASSPRSVALSNGVGHDAENADSRFSSTYDLETKTNSNSVDMHRERWTEVPAPFLLSRNGARTFEQPGPEDIMRRRTTRALEASTPDMERLQTPNANPLRRVHQSAEGSGGDNTMASGSLETAFGTGRMRVRKNRHRSSSPSRHRSHTTDAPRLRYRSDAEAFITHRPYAYLLLRNISIENEWHIRVLNYNQTYTNMLNATVRVSAKYEPTRRQQEASMPTQSMARARVSSLCPRGPGADTPTCSGNGVCRNGTCICDSDHEGRYCESLVQEVPDSVFVVGPEDKLYFRYKVRRSGAVASILHIASTESTIMQSVSFPKLYAKRLGENGGLRFTHGQQLLPHGPPLPSSYDVVFSDHLGYLRRNTMQAVVRRNMRKGEVLYLGVLDQYRYKARPAAHSKGGIRNPVATEQEYNVQLQVFPCRIRAGSLLRAATEWLVDTTGADLRAAWNPVSTMSPSIVPNPNSKMEDDDADLENESLLECPMPFYPAYWDSSVTFLILPLMLVTLTMLTMVVCITAWARVFRHHILHAMHEHFPDDDMFAPRSRGPDQLSDAEINTMFPAFMYSKDQAAALSASGDPCCSVCLSSFEESELLRRLGCGHSYHASCLDPWLHTNATCPRCRKSARIMNIVSNPLSSVAYWLRVVASRAALVRHQLQRSIGARLNSRGSNRPPYAPVRATISESEP